MKKWFIITILLVLSGLSAFSDEAAPFFETSSASYSLTPGIEYPVELGQILLTLGGQALMSAKLPFVFLPALNLNTSLAYSYIPVIADNSLSVIKLSAGAGFSLEIDPRISLDTSLRGGMYFGFFNKTAIGGDGQPYETQGGIGPILDTDAELSLYLSPSISLGLRLAYSGSFGLYHSLSAGIGARVHVEGFRENVILNNKPIPPLFPGISRFYDTNPIGEFSLKNNERFPLENIRVELFIADYMDSSQACFNLEELEPGGEVSGSLQLMFNSEVFNLVEDKPISVDILTSYYLNGEERSFISTADTYIYNRNAVTWHDDRAAAAFIYGKTPEALQWAGHAALASSDTAIKSPSRNLAIALSIFNSLKLYGLSYVIDPETLPYEEAVKQTDVIDFIQFPLQTLQYRGGDCDDLTILFCSLLEAAGVETAMLTVPGHIMPAFALELAPPEALKRFSKKNELIIDAGKAWIPVEITLLNENFFKAWGIGASTWNESYAGGTSILYPVRQAWKIYPPSPGPASEKLTSTLETQALIKIFSSDMSSFIEKELIPEETRLKRIIASSNSPAKAINSLGALYARWGLYDKAEAEFSRAVETESYLPALINLGNLRFIQSDFEGALTIFEQAEELAPSRTSIVLALSRTNFELGRLAAAKTYYARLKSRNPELAARFSYLSDLTNQTGRAASAGLMEVPWEDE